MEMERNGSWSKATTSSVKQGGVLWHGHVWWPREIGLKCMEYIICSDLAKCCNTDMTVLHRWIVTQNILQKHPNPFLWQGIGSIFQLTSTQPNWACFSEDITEGKTHKQYPKEGSFSIGLAKHLKEGHSGFGYDILSRLQVVIDCKGFSFKY